MVNDKTLCFDSELVLQMLSTLTKSSELIKHSVPAETQAGVYLSQHLQALTQQLRECERAITTFMPNDHDGAIAPRGIDPQFFTSVQ